MSPALDFMLALAAIVAAAKLGGLAATKLGQPAVLGELAAGLLLGPSAFDLISRFASPELPAVVHHLAELGVVLLMFLAGLETELGALKKAGVPATIAGTLGTVAPILLAVVVGPWYGLDNQQSIFLGLVLAATSVSISARTLMELGALRRPEGVAILGAAVVDDILAILALSVFTAVTTGGGGAGPLAIALIFAKITAFFAAAAAAGRWLLPRLVQWADTLPVSESLAATGIVLMLVFAWAAEAGGGVAMITGSFLAGVLLGRTEAGRLIDERLRPLAYGLLVPVFLVNIGLTADMRGFGPGELVQIGVLTALAVASKIVGCGGGAKAGGMGWLQSLRVGCGMASRGEVGLIIASSGLNSGIISRSLFSEFVVVALLTTLVTPVLLKLTFAGATEDLVHA
jgi:Kef-type K+ transport system membrane component KefB